MKQLKSVQEFQTVQQAFPRIADMIELHWGYESFSPVMMKLMQDSRDGTRSGFPPNVGAAILRLLALHAELFPEQHHKAAADSGDVWAKHYHR